MPTTYSEGREIRTEAPVESVEVVQLPNRDAATAAANPEPAQTRAAPEPPKPARPATPTPAVKAAKTAQTARIKKARGKK